LVNPKALRCRRNRFLSEASRIETVMSVLRAFVIMGASAG
jgi:hypothetical protein